MVLGGPTTNKKPVPYEYQFILSLLRKFDTHEDLMFSHGPRQFFRISLLTISSCFLIVIKITSKCEYYIRERMK